MQIIKYPDKKDWEGILKRPSLDSSSLEGTVKNVLHEVKVNGDEAVRKFTLQFDKAVITELCVSDAEIEQAGKSLSTELKEAIVTAKNNIEKFIHQFPSASAGSPPSAESTAIRLALTKTIIGRSRLYRATARPSASTMYILTS